MKESKGHGPVYDLRTKLGQNQSELAKELGCTLKTVWRLEQGGKTPKQAAVKRNFEKLAKKHGVSISQEVTTA